VPKERTEDLRKLSDSDLAKELEETYRRLFTQRLQMSTAQLENHRELVGTRRQIARIKTIQKEREIARRPATAAKA
jgi:large subunit ribosomal protein L29